MATQSEKSRHIGGKPNTTDEAENRKVQTEKPDDRNKTGKPKNPDVGHLKRDR